MTCQRHSTVFKGCMGLSVIVAVGKSNSNPLFSSSGDVLMLFTQHCHAVYGSIEKDNKTIIKQLHKISLYKI